MEVGLMLPAHILLYVCINLILQKDYIAAQIIAHILHIVTFTLPIRGIYKPSHHKLKFTAKSPLSDDHH